MAEGAGFEPAIRFPVYTLSRRAPSTTRPPLRIGRTYLAGGGAAAPWLGASLVRWGALSLGGEGWQALLRGSRDLSGLAPAWRPRSCPRQSPCDAPRRPAAIARGGRQPHIPLHRDAARRLAPVDLVVAGATGRGDGRAGRMTGRSGPCGFLPGACARRGFSFWRRAWCWRWAISRARLRRAMCVS